MKVKIAGDMTDSGNNILRSLLSKGRCEFAETLADDVCDVYVAHRAESKRGVPDKAAVAVVNSDVRDTFGSVPKADTVVTYGFNSRACVTVSSIAPDSMQVCVQRSLPKLGGGFLDRQEFTVPLSQNDNPETVLAAAAAALVCGVEPDTFN
jgi:UDP-N-acetylmuramyl pentapeptide synthase